MSFSLAGAKGQEALLSATSLDSEIQAAASTQTGAPRQGMQIGPVQLGLGLNASTTYNDNINGSGVNPEADLYSQLGTTMGLDWAVTDRSDLHLGTSLGYLYYAHYHGNNGLQISPDSALTYAISWDELTLTAFDQLSYSRQVQTEASLANVSSLPRLDNNGGLRGEYDPGKWTFQASYSHEDFSSDSIHAYLNHSSEYFFGRIGRFIAANSQFGVEASGGLTSYTVATEPNSDNYSVGLYAEVQLRPSIKLTMRGGPNYYEFTYPAGSKNSNSSLNSYYFTVGLTHQLTDYLSQSIQVEQSVQLGLGQGNAYTKELSATYSMSYALTQYISVSGSFTLENGSQPLTELFDNFIPYQVMENYNRYGLGLSASWQFTRHWNCNLNYNVWQRDSNLAGNSYTENSIGAGISYAF